jgi:hypothetical protein
MTENFGKIKGGGDGAGFLAFIIPAKAGATDIYIQPSNDDGPRFRQRLFDVTLADGFDTPGGHHPFAGSWAGSASEHPRSSS